MAELLSRIGADGWFTVDQLDGGTFVISEYRHWEEPHCYLLCGSRRALLIDAGLGVSDLEAVVSRLTALPVLVAVTHAHWDHIGGLGQFPAFAVHRLEAGWLTGSFPLPPEVVRRQLTRLPCRFPAGFSAGTYRVFQGTPAQLLHDGDQIELGGRSVCVLHTPGHSPGHCCFYEADRETLYSGDLLYCGCLDAFYPTTDPQQFRQSVHRVRQLPLQRILPGHHRLSVPLSLPDRAADAFDLLAERRLLHHGGGRFPFGDFQIHV